MHVDDELEHKKTAQSLESGADQRHGHRRDPQKQNDELAEVDEQRQRQQHDEFDARVLANLRDTWRKRGEEKWVLKMVTDS